MIKSKSDLTNELVFEKTDFKLISSESSSKGNVTKYTDGKLWIKTNHQGYEALAEVLSSRVVKALGFQTVEYKPCFISRNAYEVESACFSESFIENKTEYTIGRLLQQYGGFSNSDDMYETFRAIPDVISRIRWVLDLLAPLGTMQYLVYALAELIWIDSIILNEDRHLFNLVLLRDSKNRFQLINFDYGAALLSDLVDYPLAMPLQQAIYSVESKPFSRHFSSQLQAFQAYLPTSFSDDITVNISDLYTYFKTEHIARCLSILSYTLQGSEITLRINQAKESSFF